MRHYLCRIEINWADEIDFDFVIVVNEDEKREFDGLMQQWMEHDPDDEIYLSFGSNQRGEYNANEIRNAVTFKLISEEDYAVLSKLDLTRIGRDILSQIEEDIGEMLEWNNDEGADEDDESDDEYDEDDDEDDDDR